MPKFVFAYHGGPKSMTAEQGQAHMDDWVAWMDSLGSAVVDRGLAVGQSRTVGPDGTMGDGGPNPISGYSVVAAADMAAALVMAGRSPHIAIGGTIEVAQAMDMSM